MHFVEQKYELKIYNLKYKLPHIVLERRTLCFSSYKNHKLKVKLSQSSRRKKEGIFCTVYFVRRKFFLTFVFYLNVQCIEYTFRIYILLHIKNCYFIHFSCLFLKSSKAFNVSLNLLRQTFFNIYNLTFLRSQNIGKIKVEVGLKTNYFFYFMSSCTNRIAVFITLLTLICI